MAGTQTIHFAFLLLVFACHGSFKALVSIPIRFPYITTLTNLSLKVSCNLKECDRVTGMQTFDCKAHLQAFA